MWCVCSRISVSVKTATPKHFAIGSFTIVYGYIVILPVEFEFSFKMHYCSRSSRTYNQERSIEVVGIRTVRAAIIVNHGVAGYNGIGTRTRHIFRGRAIDGNGTAPCSIICGITMEYDSYYISGRSHSTRISVTEISSQQRSRSTFAVVNLNIVVIVVVWQSRKVDQQLGFGIRHRKFLAIILVFSIVSSNHIRCNNIAIKHNIFERSTKAGIWGYRSRPRAIARAITNKSNSQIIGC